MTSNPVYEFDETELEDENDVERNTHRMVAHSFETELVSEEDQRAIHSAQIELQEIDREIDDELRPRTKSSKSRSKSRSGSKSKRPSTSSAARKKQFKKKESSGKLYAIEGVDHRPVFVYLMVLICTVVCILELFYNAKWYEVNNKEQFKLHGNSTDYNKNEMALTCPILVGPFCLESFSVNFFGGPRVEVLLEMGAKRGEEIVKEWQIYRLFTCMFLHGGLVHLLMNMVALLQLGAGIERTYGTAKIAIIYIISGLFGSMTSTIFNPDVVGVGASGAIFGLFGAAWGDLLQNWELYDTPCQSFFTLLLGTALNLGLGTMPYLDNFAHFFGFVMGAIISFALLVTRRQTSSGREVEITWLHYFLGELAKRKLYCTYIIKY